MMNEHQLAFKSLESVASFHENIGQVCGQPFADRVDLRRRHAGQNAAGCKEYEKAFHSNLSLHAQVARSVR